MFNKKKDSKSDAVDLINVYIRELANKSSQEVYDQFKQIKEEMAQRGAHKSGAIRNAFRKQGNLSLNAFIKESIAQIFEIQNNLNIVLKPEELDEIEQLMQMHYRSIEFNCVQANMKKYYELVGMELHRGFELADSIEIIKPSNEITKEIDKIKNINKIKQDSNELKYTKRQYCFNWATAIIAILSLLISIINTLISLNNKSMP